MKTPGRLLSEHPLGLLCLAWIMVAVWINPVGNFPLNDDWQYAYPVQQLLERGELAFTGRFAPNIFLQIGWGYLWCLPFGECSFTILRLSTLALGLAGGMLAFKTGQLLGLASGTAFFLSSCLLFNPLYFNLSYSFMTDVPFLVLVLASLYYFLRYEKTEKDAAFRVALVFAAASYLVRQPGILLLPLYAVALILPSPGRKRSWLSALGVLLFTGILYLSVENWVKPQLGLTENYVPVSRIFLDEMLGNSLSFTFEQAKRVLKTLIYLGFFSLPLAPLLWQKVREAGLLRLQIALPVLAGNLALLILLVYVGKTFPFGGNVLFNFGLGPELLYDRYELNLPHTAQLPESGWYILQLLAQLWITGIILLMARTTLPRGSAEARFFLVLLFLNGGYLFLMSIFSYFDRYLLLPVISLFFYLGWLGRESTMRTFRQWIPWLLFALFSVLATKDYLSWNRARLAAFDFLQEAGIPITKMDAGYEYMGWYNYQPNFPDHPVRSYWWVEDDTYLITFGPVAGYEIVRTFPYRRWLTGRINKIHVLRKTSLSLRFK